MPYRHCHGAPLYEDVTSRLSCEGKQRIQEIFHEIDDDRNESVSFAEFVQYFQGKSGVSRVVVEWRVRPPTRKKPSRNRCAACPYVLDPTPLNTRSSTWNERRCRNQSVASSVA